MRTIIPASILCVIALAIYAGCPMAGAMDGDLDVWQVVVTDTRDIPTELTEVAIITVPPGQVYEIGSIMLTAFSRFGDQKLYIQARSADGTWRNIMRDKTTSSLPFGGSAIMLGGYTFGSPEYMSEIPRIIATDLRVMTNWLRPGGHTETIVTYRRVQ